LGTGTFGNPCPKVEYHVRDVMIFSMMHDTVVKKPLQQVEFLWMEEVVQALP
jgi:hypothetical protein